MGGSILNLPVVDAVIEGDDAVDRVASSPAANLGASSKFTMGAALLRVVFVSTDDDVSESLAELSTEASDDDDDDDGKCSGCASFDNPSPSRVRASAARRSFLAIIGLHPTR